MKRGRRFSTGAAILALGALLVAAGCSQAPVASGSSSESPSGSPAGPPPTFANEDFYAPDGTFREDAARDAYLRLMAYHGYPVNESTRKDLFVSDMGLGRFTEVGLACVILVNDKEWSYAGLEVFLLPGQMIPEHWHVPIESDGVEPKMESWVVRHGCTFTYGVGEPTEPMAVKIPECQVPFVSVRHEKRLGPGEMTGVDRPLDKHWQLAGPEGCILTEFATYHSGAAVRFSDPKIQF